MVNQGSITLDVDTGMREYVAENLAGSRHVAMNLLTNEKTAKIGIKRKRLKAVLSPDYLSLRGKGFRNLALEFGFTAGMLNGAIAEGRKKK